MKVNEKITENLLESNNFVMKPVRYENKPFNKGYLATYFNDKLAVFVQDYLSSKYLFTPPSLSYENSTIELFFEHTRYDKPLHTLKEFAIYMFQCNALLNVEGLEFDDTCFVIGRGSFKGLYSIPQPDGFDYIIDTDIAIDINFIKSPFFMINNIVHPATYNTKTLYLLGLYQIVKLPDFNKELIMPFGESIYNLFLKSKTLQFKDFVKKLILSQFPSFNDYFEAVLPILKTYINIDGRYPSELFIPNYYNNISFKSPLLSSINEEKIDKLSEHDTTLMSIYENNLSLPVNLLETPVYSYPNINDIDKNVIYYSNSAINYEIFLKLKNRIMGNGDPSKLSYLYNIKKKFSRYLKPYYFSHHMKYTEYGKIYKSIFSSEIPFESVAEYYPTWTLNQFKQVSSNQENLFKLIIKTVWHNNKFIASKIEKELKTLISNNSLKSTPLNDLQIYNKINELYKKNKPKDTGFDRGQFRFEEIKKLGIFSYLPRSNELTYLDFGGGIGDVSSSIAKNLNLKKENSFVTDIQNWLGKEHTDEYVKYITYRYLKTNELPFDDNKFDLITCLQVLHHIDDKKYTISQLKRIIKDDGIIIIREHDSRNSYDRTMIDIEHSLHAYSMDEQGIDYFQNYNDNYMSKAQLEELMTEAGFHKLNSYPEKGLTRYYYSVWSLSTPKQKTTSWADINDEDDEPIDLNLDKNMQPNLTKTQLEQYNVADIAEAMKNTEFPYHKYFMKPVKYYFNNLVKFNYTISNDPVNYLQGIYFKTPVSKDIYSLKYNKLKEKNVTLITHKEDYNNIDIITNFFTENARIKAKVFKGKDDAISPLEFWNKNKYKIVLDCLNDGLNSFTLRESIYRLVPEATLFKTTVAKSVYDIFKPNHILDMSSGWGDRLIAAIAYSETNPNVKYNGFDPNSDLKEGYNNIINTLAKTPSNFSVRTEPFETANIKDIKADLFFSSPPYFDFEIYSNEETQSIKNYTTYNNWIVNFLFKSIKNAFSSLVEGGYFVMHITDTGNMKNVCELIKLYIEEYLGFTYIGCIFTQSPGKRRQPMWVYTKVLRKEKSNNMYSYYPHIEKMLNKI